MLLAVDGDRYSRLYLSFAISNEDAQQTGAGTGKRRPFLAVLAFNMATIVLRLLGYRQCPAALFDDETGTGLA